MATQVTESSLTCSICFLRFRKPRALPCLHSYCEKCLVEYARQYVPKGSQVLKCPLCQETVQIPDGDVTKFKLDFRLQSQVEDATRYEKEAGIVSEIRMCTCCHGKDEDEAMATCRKCGQLLCKYGMKAHERLVVFGDHKVIPLSECDSAQLEDLVNEMQRKDETTKEVTPEKWAILVSNIPDQKCYNERMRDRLAIHFLRKRNGGGDIDGILYPLEGCPQKAVIAFTDKDASDMVLQTDHVLEELKTEVTVEPLPQVFNKVDADIDAFYWNRVPRLTTTELIDEFSKTYGKENLQTAGHILKKITCTMSQLDDVHSTIVRATGLPIARNSYSVIERGMFVRNIPYLTDTTEKLCEELRKHLQVESACQLDNLTCPVKGNVNEAIALYVSSSDRETYIGTSDKCFFDEVLQISRLPPVFTRMTAHLADFFINLLQHSGSQQCRAKLQASCGQDILVTDSALTGNPKQLQKASTTILEIIGLCDANLIPKHLSDADQQWSPVNPEGKKQYGRDFLLQFQPECKDKPDGLPHIPDIVLDKDTSESAPVPSEKKPEVKEDATPASDKPKPKEKAPEKAPAPAAKDEPKTELSTTTKTDEKESKPAESESENDKFSSNEKDVSKVEVSVVNSVDKKEREKVEAEKAKNKEYMDNEDDSNKPAPKDNKIQLKYKYRNDAQWSPVNPEGKKQYGRDFLLQFQPECTDKPDGLPHIPGIVLDKAEVRPISGVADPRLQPQRGGGGRGGVDFMPDFMRSPRGSGQAPQFPQAGGRRGSSRETRTVIARDSMNLSEEEAKTEKLIKTFKRILNKLTPQNFQNMMAKTLQLPIDNEERLTAIIDLLFEKANTEPAFSKAYASMCQVFSQIKVPAANASGLVQFRTVLINSCQRAFEAEKKDEGTFAEMKKEIEKLELGSEQRTKEEEELFILQVKAKQKVLGNMRFIGELFKLHMLTEPIMHDCIFKLLRAKDDESLECMSQLMKTVGKDLDHERAKNRMDQYFNQMAKIIGNKKVSSRIRFMLQDVQDLRRSNWIPRRDDDNPETITQIHHKSSKEEEPHKKIEAQMNPQHHATKSKEESRGGRPAPPSPGDDWQTVTTTQGRPQIDPSKLINLGSNRPETDNVQQGPGGRPGAFGIWGRGSSGGGAKMQSSDQVDLRPSGNNRFSILSGSDRGARPGMGPPTRDSKGRPTGTIPGRWSREDDRRGSSREENQRRERQKLLDDVSRRIGQGGARSRSSEKDWRLSRERGGGSRGSREGGSRDRGSRERGSRERGARDSRERATPSPTMGKPKAPATPELSDEDYETKGRATLDQYLNIRDMKEACQCISEMSSPERMHLFVRLSIEHVLEMDAKSRLATGTLFHKLIRLNILSFQQYLQGLNEVLEFADDMAIDIPLIWQYLGELMGSMIQDKEQSIEYLGKALGPVKAADKGGVLLAEILRTAEKNIGVEDLNYLWQSSGFTWEQFLPSDENVLEFVRSKKLEYTLQKSKTDPLALMVKELTFMLARKEKLDNDNVFEWIKKNIDPELTKQKDFIRALVTVVCQSTIEAERLSIRCDPELLKVRAKCLLRYIDGDQDKELQALFAVQTLNHKLVNPPGFLRIIFDVLYDEDVISEETFYAWQNSTDPAEQNGKGNALKSVTNFFAWIGESEEEAPN